MLGEDTDGLDFENDLGMTAARQAEVRAAIFAMLGDNSMRLPPTPSAREGEQRTVDDVASVVFPVASAGSTHEGSAEWSCTACTLLNPSTRLDCSACGTYHMSE